MIDVNDEVQEYRRRALRFIEAKRQRDDATNLTQAARDDLLTAQIVGEMIPALEDRAKLAQRVAELEGKLIVAEKRVLVESRRADAERIRGLEGIARLQRNIESMRVAAAEGELLEAQLDLALAEHGYDYPKGVRGWRDLLSHHDDLKVVAKLRGDALELIKKALNSDKPRSLEKIVVELHEIIETWENDENDR